MFTCKHCDYTCKTIREARQHAKTAGTVWNPERQTFTTHGLERQS